MSDALKIRRTRPLTVLLADLLSMPVPRAMRLRLAGLRQDGSKKRGRPRTGAIQLEEGATFGDAICLALLARALSGDVMAMRTIFNQTEGTPTRAIALTSVVGEVNHAALDAKIRDFLGLSHLPPKGTAAPKVSEIPASDAPEADAE